MKKLLTHFEIVSKQTVFTYDMAMAILTLYENQTGKKFEIREVAE